MVVDSLFGFAPALLIHIDLATREEGPSRKSTVDLNQNSTDI